MLFQLNSVALMLVALIVLGVVSHNSTVTIAAAVLLIMQQTVLVRYADWLDKHAIYWGIVILTIGVLSPLVSGRIQLPNIVDMLNFKMFAAVVVGILVAWLGGRGVVLMTAQPTVVTGVLIGTVIGVAFFRGIPVGPLIAAGILSLVVGKS